MLFRILLSYLFMCAGMFYIFLSFVLFHFIWSAFTFLRWPSPVPERRSVCCISFELIKFTLSSVCDDGVPTGKGVDFATDRMQWALNAANGKPSKSRRYHCRCAPVDKTAQVPKRYK